MPITKSEDVIGLIKKAPSDLKFSFTLFGKEPTLYVSKTEPARTVRDKMLAAARAEKVALNHTMLVCGTVAIAGVALTFTLISDKIPTGLGKQIKRYFKLNKKTFQITIANSDGTARETVAEDDDDDALVAPPTVGAPADGGETLITRDQADEGRSAADIKADYKKKAEALVAWAGANEEKLSQLLQSDAAYVRQLLAEGARAWNGGKQGQYDIAFKAYDEAKRYFEGPATQNHHRFRVLHDEVKAFIDDNGISPRTYAELEAAAMEAHRKGAVPTRPQRAALAINRSGRLPELQAAGKKLWQKIQAHEDREALENAFGDLKSAYDAAVAAGDAQLRREDTDRAESVRRKEAIDAKLARAKAQLDDPGYAQAVANVSRLIESGKDSAAALAGTAEKDFTPPVEGEDAALVNSYRGEIQTAFCQLVDQRHQAFLKSEAYRKAGPERNLLIAAVVDERLRTLSTNITGAFVKVTTAASSEKSLDAAFKWAAAAHEGELKTFVAGFERQTQEQIEFQIAQYDSLQEADKQWRRQLNELDTLVLRAAIADKPQAGALRDRLKTVRADYAALNVPSSTDYDRTATQLEALAAGGGAYALLKRDAEAAIAAKRTAAQGDAAKLRTTAEGLARDLAALKEQSGSFFRGDKDTLRVVTLFERAATQLPDPEEIADDPAAAKLFAEKAADFARQLAEMKAGAGPIKQQADLLASIDGYLKRVEKADTKGWYKDDLEKEKNALLKAGAGEREGDEAPGDHEDYIGKLRAFDAKLADLTPRLEGFFQLRIAAKERLARIEATLSDLQVAIARRSEFFLSVPEAERAEMQDTNVIRKSVYRGKQAKEFSALRDERATRVDPANVLADRLPNDWDGRCTKLEAWLASVWDAAAKSVPPSQVVALQGDIKSAADDLKKAKDLKAGIKALKTEVDARREDIDAVLGTGEHDVLVKRIETIETLVDADLDAAAKQFAALEREWRGRKGALDGGEIDSGPAALPKTWRAARRHMLDGIDPLFAAVAKTLPNVPDAARAAADARRTVAEHLSRLFHQSAFDLCTEMIDADRKRQQKRELKEQMLQQVKLYRDALVGDPICMHLQRNTVGQGALFTRAFQALRQAEVELLRYNP